MAEARTRSLPVAQIQCGVSVGRGLSTLRLGCIKLPQRCGLKTCRADGNYCPTTLFHSYYGGNSGPYQNTSFPILQPPNVSMQNGWSQDQAAPLYRHLFMV